MNPRLAAVCKGWDPARANSPTGVVLASGRTDDLFFLHAPARLVPLREGLEETSRSKVDRFVSYSQVDGLRETGSAVRKARADGQPAPAFSPARAAREAALRAAERVAAVGRFRTEPPEALMEIDAALRGGERVLALVDGVGVWEAVSELRPDVLAALQSWLELCRRSGSLVVFAGHRLSERLRGLFAGRPGVREHSVTGPTEEEIADWMVTREISTGTPRYSAHTLPHLTGFLRGVAALPGNGLITLAGSLSSTERTLDTRWLKEQGADAVDPADVDVDGLRDHLAASFIGQLAAREAVLSMAGRVRLRGLSARRQRPIWRALFAGPAGVGKTELAKVLSRFFFANDRCCMVACTEFQQEHDVARLLGAPPGYIGYGEPGVLGEFLSARRAGVVLFDEFEKAHPAVHRAVMGILEEGTLTTGDGTVLRFQDCIVIATTNEGSAEVACLREQLPNASPEQFSKAYEEALLRRFHDYGLRRFDARVVFDPLTADELGKVAELHIARRVADDRADFGLDAEVTWSASLVRTVLAQADPRLGAGEVRNVVEQLVGERLAERYYGLTPRPSLVCLDP